MYGSELTESLAALRDAAQLEGIPYWILDASLSCFLEAAIAALGGRTTPPADFVGTSLRLLVITDAISRSPSVEWRGIHYLVGLAYEQCAFLISSLNFKGQFPEDPLNHDEWSRLVLAVLHYLSGGYRVQAVAALRRLREIADREQAPAYLDATAHVRALFDARTFDGAAPRWRRILFLELDLPDPVEAMLNRLARQVRAQRGILLSQLGRDSLEQWLAQRGIVGDTARDFWRLYLGSLENRGIVSFTREQFGEGFDTWLQLDSDLLVVLPTGAGKSLVGELRTALTLAAGHSCVWIQPTRALVRQSQRELRRAFRPAGIQVEELPTSEDASELFTDEFDKSGAVIATTTPERLSAMLRSNPSSMAKHDPMG